MYSLFKPLLFKIPAETAHNLTVKLFKFGLKIPGTKMIFSQDEYFNPITIDGLIFPNRLGLAAGFDKNAYIYEEMGLLGFGFIEIGTVTPRPQEGNPQPRLFRLSKDKALINRMGFNNKGVDYVAERLKKNPSSLLIGGNIGKNKTTPNEKAVEDYLTCLVKLHPYVDYFTVNVSSPNTPNLRDLQNKEKLAEILNPLMVENKKLGRKPLFLKIAPDISMELLDEIIELTLETGISGLIATNTTISREGLKTGKEDLKEIGDGGLSGAPLKNRSTEIIKYISKKSNRSIPLIASGGIMSGEDALEKINAGASLVQVYTGLIYKGPKLIKEINKTLLKN